MYHELVNKKTQAERKRFFRFNSHHTIFIQTNRRRKNRRPGSNTIDQHTLSLEINQLINYTFPLFLSQSHFNFTSTYCPVLVFILDDTMSYKSDQWMFPNQSKFSCRTKWIEFVFMCGIIVSNNFSTMTENYLVSLKLSWVYLEFRCDKWKTWCIF